MQHGEHSQADRLAQPAAVGEGVDSPQQNERSSPMLGGSCW